MIYLGTIANAGSDVVNNRTTAAPFTIPGGTRALRLQPSAATQMAATKGGDDSTFLPAATDMLQLGGANSVIDVPINSTGVPTALTLAIRKTDAGAGTCKVFAIHV
jgi:hypothetical protein